MRTGPPLGTGGFLLLGNGGKSALNGDMPKKANPTMPLLFVDTNIFLNSYRFRGEAGLKLLEHVESVADSLIMTDQVEFEFVKNRPNVINETLNAIKAPVIPVPAYLRASRAANAIEKHQAKITTQLDVLKKRFEGILKDPARNDPVLKSVRRLIKNNPLSLKFASEELRKRIFDKAFLRFHRNFPPRKPKDSSIGDAINWEWIMHCGVVTKRDVLTPFSHERAPSQPLRDSPYPTSGQTYC
jgi:hypothetical protein